MAQRIATILQRGLQKFRESPQLLLTVFVALAIIGSFVFVSLNFLGIARDAQEQLVKVRIGSLQDAFAPLAAELWQQPDVLRSYMRDLKAVNQTIVDFDIVGIEASSSAWVVLRSSDQTREGARVFREDLLLSLARSDVRDSFTIGQNENGIAYFLTARAIVDRSGELLGIILTRQALSAADAVISSNIRTAVTVLVVVLLLLLLLFFRHARIIDYTILYRKLREVDTLKDEFVAMASHELRAPLTAISGYAEMLRDGTLQGEARTQGLERIELSARQLNTLISDILDVSRIEQGRMKIESKRFDTKTMLAELCDIWEARAKEKGIALQRELADDLSIEADPDRFRQVVINLLSNAVKYTGSGTITVRTAMQDGRFVLRVSDTGIGMTEEEREKLFGKFYRAGGADVRKESGTGLGLWITKELLERMGGRISVESIKGVGSHFIVLFPLATASGT